MLCAQRVEPRRNKSITLLDVEGQKLFTVLARRFTKYMFANKFIDTSVQKGGVERLAGCCEHKSMISQLLKDNTRGTSR